MKAPPGYQQCSKVLHLQKALYSLCKSLLLWQRHFTNSLLEQGYIRIPHKPYAFAKDRVIIFLYMDDIILAYCKEHQKAADLTVKQLKQEYSI